MWRKRMLPRLHPQTGTATADTTDMVLGTVMVRDCSDRPWATATTRCTTAVGCLTRYSECTPTCRTRDSVIARSATPTTAPLPLLTPHTTAEAAIRTVAA